MARLKESILKNATEEGIPAERVHENGTWEAYSERHLQPMVDISEPSAGQNGPFTNFEGYVSNSTYVRRNLIAVLIEAPRGFDHLPDSDKWRKTLKALVELQADSIEGLTSTLTADFVEHAVGGAGEMQEDISNVTRARSTPTFNWTEKYGKPINAFLTGWITELLMDPISKVPGVVTRALQNGENTGNNTPPGPTPDMLPDFTGMTVLFFEPDPTHTRVIHAWLCTNMHPKTAGEVVGNRDLTSAGESVQYSVEFTSLTQEGYGVRLYAQRVLDEMNENAINPNTMPAFVENWGDNRRSDSYDRGKPNVNVGDRDAGNIKHREQVAPGQIEKGSGDA